ncbi:hypothetical protein [Gordonia sp. (in: high G+C Gram-positive bacteria)]|uniref:TPR repeat region-containing protein n=1 Tax=Gordonia sp. (in: high G+C Gram-positive bacteria) TaxID=84139 RepID=UPI003C753856
MADPPTTKVTVPPVADKPAPTAAPAPTTPVSTTTLTDPEPNPKPAAGDPQNPPPETAPDETPGAWHIPMKIVAKPNTEISAFVDKDGDGVDDKTGKPVDNDSEPGITEVAKLTPEDQAKIDKDATVNGPPTEPQLPEKPADSDTNKQYQEDLAKYGNKKLEYDNAKRSYDAASARIQAAMQLAEEQKQALDRGEIVTLDSKKARYITAFLKEAAGNGDNSDQLIDFTEKNPELKASISAGLYLVTSEQVRQGKKGPVGSIDNPPKGVRNTLTKPVSIEDWERTNPNQVGGIGPFPGKSWGSDIPDIRRYKDLANLLGASDRRYRTSSAIDEQLTYRAGEIASAMNDVREAGAILGSRHLDDDRTEGLFSDTLNEMLAVSGDDEQATVKALSQPNSRKNIIDPLLTHDWAGKDLINGQVNTQFGVNKVFSSIEKNPRDPTVQAAANNVAHALSNNSLLNHRFGRDSKTKQLGDASPGLVRTLAQSLSPYYADLAGYEIADSAGKEIYPGVEGLTGKNQFTDLLSVLATDVEAGSTVTQHVRSQADYIVEQFGRGAVGADAIRIAGAMDNSLMNAVDKVISSDIDKQRYRASIKAAKESANFDAGRSFVLGAVGEIPAVGSPAASILGVGSEYFKLGSLGVLDLSQVESSKAVLTQMMPTKDKSTYITDKTTDAFFAENPELERQFYRDNPRYAKGAPGWEENRQTGNFDGARKKFLEKHGIPVKEAITLYDGRYGLDYEEDTEITRYSEESWRESQEERRRKGKRNGDN